MCIFFYIHYTKIFQELKMENYSPSKLEGVAEGRGRLFLSPKLGEMAQSAREVCLRARKGRKSRKGIENGKWKMENGKWKIEVRLWRGY